MNQNPKQPKIIFFGNESVATGVTTNAPLLRSLISHHYNVCLVVINKHTISSRHKQELAIERVAKEFKIPLVSPDKLSDINDQIKSLQPTLGVLVAYGRIIPETTLKLFDCGIINIHPSLLPEYRGSTPIEHAILDGRTQTGVTVMLVTPEMDAGPILDQAKLRIHSSYTKQTLADKLLLLGHDMVLKLIPKILAGQFTTHKQNNNAATYTKLISKSDGKLDGEKNSLTLLRQIKAYAGWPGSYLDYKGSVVNVLEANQSNLNVQSGQLAKLNKKLYFGTRDGAIEITLLKPASKSVISAREFINGHQELPIVKS